MGDDWTWRWGREFLSTGERGEDARTGDDESGEDVLGRWWSHVVVKTGLGEKESMVRMGADRNESLVFVLCMCAVSYGKEEEYATGRSVPGNACWPFGWFEATGCRVN